MNPHRPRRRRKRRRPHKDRAQIAHAWKRAFQRTGQPMSAEDNARVVAMIQAGEATFCFRQSNRVTHWLIEWGGQTVRVVYDRKRQTIVTVLPPEPEAVTG